MIPRRASSGGPKNSPRPTLGEIGVDTPLAQVHILQQLDHPNIVKLHAFFDEPTMFYLVMDLIEGGELFERIAEKEFYSEKEARDLMSI